MLLSRVGQKKQRLWPWFEPPVAPPPMRYDGWFWEPRNKEWLPTEMVPMTIAFEPKRFPKPTQMPSRDFSSEQPGWSYSFTTFEWVQTIIMSEPVDLVPPRSLPPYVTDEMILAGVPLLEQHRLFYERLVSLGLQPHEAKRIADITGEYIVGLMKAKYPFETKTMWKNYSVEVENQWWILKQEILIKGGLILIAAAIGYLIGTIMEGLTFPDIDVFTLKEPAGTYLMRYDHYLYSKMVALTRTGKPYYSACEDIGTSWIRHRRAPIGGRVDVIDFPGGFVEEGHVGIWFVKYTWSAWLLEYIGFLTNVGGNYYVMREGNRDRYAVGKAPFTLPSSQWCTGLHWYL